MYALKVLTCIAWVLDPMATVQACIEDAGYKAWAAQLPTAMASIECDTDAECVDADWTAFLSNYVAQGRK
jgi:hypothetical protein